MKIGKYFTLAELTVTNSGHSNVPSELQISGLKELACIHLDNIVERYSKFLNRPIKMVISSCFRSAEVNKHVGGSPTSSHTKGLAIDFDIKGIDTLDFFKWLIQNMPIYDQIIYEHHGDISWVHYGIEKLSKGKKARKQILVSLKKKEYKDYSLKEAIELKDI